MLSIEIVMRRRAVLERAETAQKLAFLAAEQGDIDEGLRANGAALAILCKAPITPEESQIDDGSIAN